MRIIANTDRPYLYIFKHGIGPGTIPNDVSIVKVKDLPNYYTAVWLDRFLTTSELKKYDIPSETEINKYLNWIGYCQKDGDVVPCNEVEACGNITASKKIVASKMSDIDLLMHEALECTTKDELGAVISGLDSLGLRKLYLHYMEMLRDDSLSVGYIASDLSDTLYNMFSGKVNACGNVMASHMWDDENFDWEDYGDPDSFGGFASPEDFENWYQNLGSHDSGKDVKASRTINKWNRETEQYDPVEIPDDWNVKMYSEDMDEIINCPNCGKELPYGEGYTSRRYHNKYGMGYMECEDCYYDQLKEERGGNDVNACDKVNASTKPKYFANMVNASRESMLFTSNCKYYVGGYADGNRRVLISDFDTDDFDRVIEGAHDMACKGLYVVIKNQETGSEIECDPDTWMESIDLGGVPEDIYSVM